MLHFRVSAHLRRGCHGRFRTALLALLLALLSLTPVRAQTGGQEAKGFLIESQPGGATVSIEGEIIGKTPCSFPYQLAGKYRLFAEKRGYESVSREIDFGARKIETITFMLSPKTQSKAMLRSFFVTGWGQNYSEQPLKGKIFMGLQGACLIGLGVAHVRSLHYEDEHRLRQDAYRVASLQLDQEEAAWQAVQSSFEDWRQADQWRRAMIYAAAGVHLINFLDAILVFPKSLRQIEFLAAPGAGQSVPQGNGFSISYSIPLQEALR